MIFFCCATRLWTTAKMQCNKFEICEENILLFLLQPYSPIGSRSTTNWIIKIWTFCVQHLRIEGALSKHAWSGARWQRCDKIKGRHDDPKKHTQFSTFEMALLRCLSTRGKHMYEIQKRWNLKFEIQKFLHSRLARSPSSLVWAIKIRCNRHESVNWTMTTDDTCFFMVLCFLVIASFARRRRRSQCYTIKTQKQQKDDVKIVRIWINIQFLHHFALPATKTTYSK